MTTWKVWGQKLATKLSYPKPVIYLINNISSDTSIKLHDDAKIKNGCKLTGNISIDKNVLIGDFTHLMGNVNLEKSVEIRDEYNYLVGDINVERHSYINGRCRIYGNVNIGKYTAIGPDVSMWEKNHRTELPSQGHRIKNLISGDLETHSSEGPITIGHDVWIGNKVTILSGTNIGHGAIIGAGSVVTKDVQPYAVIGGNPANRIGWRFNSSIRSELLDIEWWNWTEEKILSNTEFFRLDLRHYDRIPSKVIN